MGGINFKFWKHAFAVFTETQKQRIQSTLSQNRYSVRTGDLKYCQFTNPRLACLRYMDGYM